MKKAAELAAADTIKVVYQSTPLDTIATTSRVVRDVPFQGWTVREHILQFVDEAVLDNPENKIVVIVDDERIPREEWDTTIPPAGSLLGIVAVPQVTALAGLLVSAGIGATAATIIATVVIMGAMIGLNILLGILLAPKAPDGSDGGSNALLLSGAKNELRPFRSVPRVYGNWRFSPPIAASAITEPSGDRFQTVRQLFTWGPGPLLIENLKIGDTDFDSFVDAESETKTITAGDKVVSLYQRLAQDLSPDVLLRDQHPRTEW
ncbi:hypothetical protein LCGC14_2604990, partial [marine sediment metagenome]